MLTDGMHSLDWKSNSSFNLTAIGQQLSKNTITIHASDSNSDFKT